MKLVDYMEKLRCFKWLVHGDIAFKQWDVWVWHLCIQLCIILPATMQPQWTLVTLHNQGEKLWNWEYCRSQQDTSCLLQICGHLFSDKCTKERITRKVRSERNRSMYNSVSPTPEPRGAWGGWAECGELGRRREKALNFPSSQKSDGSCSTDTTDLLWWLRHFEK